MHNAQVQDSKSFVFIQMNEIEEFESAEESEEDEPTTSSNEDEEVTRRMFKTDLTRNKYERFVKIKEIFPTTNKKIKNEGDGGEMAIRELSENVRYECRVCNKILSTQVGGTGNIRKHLKVNF